LRKLCGPYMLPESFPSGSSSEHLLRCRFSNPSVIWLHERLLYLSILNQKGISLATNVSKQRTAVESKVQLLTEGSIWIGKEADTALATRIQRLSPCLGYEGVIDAQNKDVSSLL